LTIPFCPATFVLCKHWMVVQWPGTNDACHFLLRRSWRKTPSWTRVQKLTDWSRACVLKPWRWCWQTNPFLSSSSSSTIAYQHIPKTTTVQISGCNCEHSTSISINTLFILFFLDCHQMYTSPYTVNCYSRWVHTLLLWVITSDTVCARMISASVCFLP
jgi:hypothetical protein